MSTSSAVPPPIPGEQVDPVMESKEATARKLDDRQVAVGIAFRAFTRFSHAKATLLAAGTTYYLFLSLFAVIALGFGIAALLGSEDIQTAIQDALQSVFPGLVGDGGLDTQQLQALGRSTSLVGLVLLVYSASGAIGAAAASLHMIYGAPRDGRSFVVGKARLLGLTLVFAPLVLVSFTPALLLGLAEPVLDALGLSGSAAARTGLVVLSLLVSFALDVVILYLQFTLLGGIRPSRRARRIGALVGAVGIEIVKALLTFIVSWSVSKPEYGAFAVPITILLILYLMSLVTYAAASVCAAVAETEDQA